MTRPRAALAMSTEVAARLLTPDVVERLSELALLDPRLVLSDFGSPAGRAALADAEVLVTSWGCPRIDASVLPAAPMLRAVVHAAGSVKEHVTVECFRRGIVVSTAAEANARPVAEYALAAILLANKDVPALAAAYRRRRAPVDLLTEHAGIGNYDRVVGVVGASRVGRRLLELLRSTDLEVVLSDPYLDPAAAAALGVTLLPLDDLVAVSDVVSLHAPALPETRHLIDRRRLARMRDGATLLNTARGSLVDGRALQDELVSGRLRAVLDVTVPEVLPADSPLWELPNVLLTPHVAGSAGRELRRLAHSAADELARYAAGQPFRHPVTLADLARVA